MDRVAALQRVRHGGGNQDEWDTVALRDERGGGEVRRAGAGDDEADARFAGRTRVAICREARATFMPRDDRADRRMVVQAS